MKMLETVRKWGLGDGELWLAWDKKDRLWVLHKLGWKFEVCEEFSVQEAESIIDVVYQNMASLLEELRSIAAWSAVWCVIRGFLDPEEE